jgi:hypothetical protein
LLAQIEVKILTAKDIFLVLKERPTEALQDLENIFLRKMKRRAG